MEYLYNLFLHRTMFAFYMTHEDLADGDLDALMECYGSLFRIERNAVEELKATFGKYAFREATDQSKTYLLSRICEYEDKGFTDFELKLIPKMVQQVDVVEKLREGFPAEAPMLYILERSANGGDLNCICLLAVMLKNGIILRKDTEAAEKLIVKAADYHCVDGLIMYLEDNESERASSALRAAMNGYSTRGAYSSLCGAAKASDGITKYDAFSSALEQLFDERILQRGRIEVVIPEDTVERLTSLSRSECLAVLKRSVAICKQLGQSELTVGIIGLALKENCANRIGF